MKKIFLAALSGVLYTLSFPSYNLWPFAWIFAVPLFFVVQETLPLEAFVYGLIAGLVAWAGTLYWIGYVMNYYGDMSLFAATFLLLLLMIYLSLYFALFTWSVRRLIHMRFSFITVPGMWILFELLRSYLFFSGFPWALIGHSQLPFKALIQICEFGGVYLISGLILMVNVSIYRAFRKDFISPLVTICVMVLCLTWGNWRMNTIKVEGEPLKAGVAQANIPQDTKWLPEMVEPAIDTYSSLSRSAFDQGAEIVVWPETACSFFLFRELMPTIRIRELSQNTNAKLLLGSPAYEEGKYFNRVWLLQNGKIEGWYDKIHLVPFGEYLPLADLIEPFFKKLTHGVGNFSQGNDPTPIGEVGVLICFESIFPDMSRTLCNKGATYITNVSNDAWFKTWSTPEQHLQMACFRAVENRRWLLRAVNHGISAIVNPSGEIVSEIGLLIEGVMVQEIRRNTFLTFYTKYGPVLPCLWALISLIVALTTYYRNVRALNP